LLGRRLAVAIPETVLEERDSPRDKMVKLGMIARACSVYGVDTIQIFKDDSRRGELGLIKKVLEYLETPQYLRKRLYPLDETLRYAGLLPPLRIPSHKPKIPLHELVPGDTREGVANSDGTVDIGLDGSVKLKDCIEPNKRVTVRIVSTDPLRAELTSRERVPEYWGYSVQAATLNEVFLDKRFELKLATSKLGSPLRSIVPILTKKVAEVSSLKLIFGSPTKGLFEIVGPDLKRRADFVVNLFADQHVETVRTEEAIFAGLSLVNVLTVSESLSANRKTGFEKG